jgi:hypothetical protein
MSGITPRPEPEIYEIKIREYFINNSLGFYPIVMKIQRYSGSDIITRKISLMTGLDNVLTDVD